METYIQDVDGSWILGTPSNGDKFKTIDDNGYAVISYFSDSESPIRHISKGSFHGRFTLEEQKLLEQIRLLWDSSDPIEVDKALTVRAIDKQLALREFVDLDFQPTIDGINYLAAIGIIQAHRVLNYLLMVRKKNVTKVNNMFQFTRGGIDYEIKYANQGDDDLLVCEYNSSGTKAWRSVLDTTELVNPRGLWANDERAFLTVFLNNLNKSLDKAHSDGDAGSDDVKERLTALIKNGLSFDGKHVTLAS